MQKAGRLALFIYKWQEITADPVILSWISGYHIPFARTVTQLNLPIPPEWSVSETQDMSKNISKLSDMGAISACQPCSGQFLSPIFLVPKADGSQRFILNLKRLNTFTKVDHFKMEDRTLALKLLRPGCFMATVDLLDAYFMVPIAKSCRKFLRFSFQNVLYEFNCLPFGLNTAPLVFTKIMKPLVAWLRAQGFLSVVYLDDFLLIGNTESECRRNVETTCNLLQKLGFLINVSKSRMIPTRNCLFLGFQYDSLKMQISIPADKQTRAITLIHSFLGRQKCKIREWARLIGTLVSLCPATRYGWLYTKRMERAKFLALIRSAGNYDQWMNIPDYTRRDLIWWKNNITGSYCPIREFKFVTTIYTDASSTGWGAVCGDCRAHGHWNDVECNKHINALELLAVLFGLKCYASSLSNCEILFRVDNTTAISYVNRMGGIQYPELSDIAYQIWNFCEQRDLWIFASYIQSSDNCEADAESRRLLSNTEWSLSQYAFQKVVKTFGSPSIDLFATRLNNKCPRFVSWFPDPEAQQVDAFTLNWSSEFFYAFPPFSIVSRALHKIITDKARGILIIPSWPNQPWYPLYLSLLVIPPLLFSPHKQLLSCSSLSHPLWRSITLEAGLLSGRPLPSKICQ